MVSTPKWYVYIIQSQTRHVLYTGITTDLARRLHKHNTGSGAKYTRGKGPWKPVYVEGPLSSKGDALRREAQLKKLPRAAKLALTNCCQSEPEPS